MLVPPASADQAPADALVDDPWATVQPARTTRPGDPDDAGRRRGWPATDGTTPAAQDEPHSEPAPGPPERCRLWRAIPSIGPHHPDRPAVSGAPAAL